MATSKNHLPRCDNTMTEAQYLSWIRSALRSKWLKWPPRAACIKSSRRPYVGPNKLQKFEVECKLCNNWFKTSDIEVDHFKEGAGSILSIDDIGQFCNNLYCDSSKLRTVCKPCHKTYTLSERKGITFEEAALQKRITEKMKDKDLLAFLAENGYTGSSVSNVKKRREAVSKLLSD